VFVAILWTEDSEQNSLENLAVPVKVTASNASETVEQLEAYEQQCSLNPWYNFLAVQVANETYRPSVWIALEIEAEDGVLIHRETRVYIGNELHVDPDRSISTSSVQNLSSLVTENAGIAEVLNVSTRNRTEGKTLVSSEAKLSVQTVDGQYFFWGVHLEDGSTILVTVGDERVPFDVVVL
jgi:hypothetical protein